MNPVRNLVGITSPDDMDELELRLLGELYDEVPHAIAVSHVELIIIHPFREGNGRLSRLLADVMAVQAGHQPLDYSSWEQHKAAYIGAIHSGFSGDYRPMAALVAEAMAAGDACDGPEVNGPA